MKLTKDEIVRAGDASPMDLFAQGTRSKETLEKYSRTLRQVTCEFLEEILEGEFGERVAQLVRYAREEPEWTRDPLLNLSGSCGRGRSWPGTTRTTSTPPRLATISSRSKSSLA